MDPVMAGVRFNPNLYVTFYLDPESGDMYATVELKLDDGTIQIINGSVVWEEGE